MSRYYLEPLIVEAAQHRGIFPCEPGAELKRKVEIRELTKEELRKMSRGVEASRFQPVPAIYQTRSMLLDLANTNVAEFRSLVKRCGEQQINKILAGKN